MTNLKIEKIKANILANKDISKNIANSSYYSHENFISDSKQYIKAIADGRMLCNIVSVSNSGMSRILNFRSCEKSKNGFYYRNYYAFFKAMGYTEVRDGFRIGGCGMDMIFHTNYTIIRRLFALGFISKKQCEKLCQKTPTTI